MKICMFAFLLSATAVAGASGPNIRTTDSSVSSSTTAQYNCIFENQWTRERHPKDYPWDAVHWTRQVLASHDSTYNMWEEGTLASTAVKKMTEAGGTADIIQDLEDRNNDYELGYEKYNSAIDPTMSFNNPLLMTSTNRYVSVISKMAPSPDWFSGFHDFNAVNEDKDTWYKQFTIETYPYDAGTEDGDDYDVVNSPTEPPQPITQFTVDNVPGDGIYVNNGDVLPVAKYTCTLNTYSSSNVDIFRMDSAVLSSRDVQYDCIFENQWNKDRHPYEFPEDAVSVHWTKQVLASHDDMYSMWKEGEVASRAVEKLAESGAVGNILKELQSRGNDYDVGYAKYLYAQDPKVIYEPLKMTSQNRYISAIAKLAPSPDWFSGFHDFNAVNEESDTWYEEIHIPIYPFDAGTEDGESYNTVNSETVPAQPITQFTLDDLPSDEIFMNSNGDAILPVGTYICTLSLLESNPTQSPIFAELTRSPATGAAAQGLNALRTKDTANVGVIVGVTIGVIATLLVVGAVVFTLVCRSRRSSKDVTFEESSSTSLDEGGVEGEII